MHEDVLHGMALDLLGRGAYQVGFFGPAFILLENNKYIFWSCGFARKGSNEATIGASSVRKVKSDMSMSEFMSFLADHELPVFCDRRVSELLPDYHRIDINEGVCYTKKGMLTIYNTEETYCFPE